jgi:hypothetical protein
VEPAGTRRPSCPGGQLLVLLVVLRAAAALAALLAEAAPQRLGVGGAALGAKAGGRGLQLVRNPFVVRLGGVGLGGLRQGAAVSSVVGRRRARPAPGAHPNPPPISQPPPRTKPPTPVCTRGTGPGLPPPSPPPCRAPWPAAPRAPPRSRPRSRGCRCRRRRRCRARCSWPARPQTARAVPRARRARPRSAPPCAAAAPPRPRAGRAPLWPPGPCGPRSGAPRCRA